MCCFLSLAESPQFALNPRGVRLPPGQERRRGISKPESKGLVAFIRFSIPTAGNMMGKKGGSNLLSNSLR